MLSLTYILAASLALGWVSAANSAHKVSKANFHYFQRYAKFTAASIPTTGCPNPPYGAHVIAYINESSTDTQARFFIDHRAKEIIFAAPGTATERDQQIDSNYTQVAFDSPGVHCDRCLTHGGFLDAWNSISKRTHSILRKAHHKYPHYKIIMTGHSLGGAIAALGWISLQGAGFKVNSAYTYGQPRVGNRAFANYIDRLAGATDRNDGRFHRITHAADPVPNEPGLYGDTWIHGKTQFWEAGKTHQSYRTTWRCYGQEPSDCSNGQQGAPDPNDHMLYSNVNFNNAYAYCGY